MVSSYEGCKGSDIATVHAVSYARGHALQKLKYEIYIFYHNSHTKFNFSSYDSSGPNFILPVIAV